MKDLKHKLYQRLLSSERQLNLEIDVDRNWNFFSCAKLYAKIDLQNTVVIQISFVRVP
jgi:hypothetical protein